MSSLGQTISQVRSYRETHERASGAAEAAAKVSAIGDAWADIHDRETRLMVLMDEIEEQHSIATQPIPDVDPLIELQNKAQKAYKQVNGLACRIEDVKLAQIEVLEDIKLAKQAEDLFHEKMGDTCPLCGKSLS